MRTLKTLSTLALLVLLTAPTKVQAQAEDGRPAFVVMTRTHFNLENRDGSPGEWMELEQEYLEKVTKKNEYIQGTVVLTHYYTADNSEVILVSTYSSWENIEKAQDRTDELVQEAWPDEDARNAYFDKRDAYYLNIHSDEIYRTLPGAKQPSEEMGDESMVVYIQKRHINFPDDGSEEEAMAVHNEYLEKVIKKNDAVKAFYPLRHAWGSDNREKLEVSVVESLSAIEAANDNYDELAKAAWPDEDARNAFFDKMDKYYTGWHGDFIYRTVPELSK